MVTLIFLLIFATLLAMIKGRRRLACWLFVASFLATALLFWHHATETLEISL